MAEDFFDWLADRPFRIVGLIFLVAVLGMWALLTLTHSIPWFSPFDMRWHDKQVCHMQPVEIVLTETSYSNYTYYDNKGIPHVGTHSTTTYIHTGRYENKEVCTYE